MKSKYSILLASMGFAAFLLGASPASGQVSLGAAEDFAVLGGTAVTCTNSIVTGEVGVYPGSAITQTSCTINGTLHPGDTAAQQAHAAFLAAYDALALEPCTGFLDTVYTDATLTLPPGVYCNAADVTFTRTTLTLAGDSNDVWIFRIGTGGTGALTGTNFSVVMAGGGESCDNNVFWWTAEAATLTDSFFLGSILSGAAITVTDGSLDGQALAKAAVTLTDTDVSVCGSTPPPHGRIKVTGGGQIPVPNPDSTRRATFGFNAKGNADGTASGHFNYLNHVTGLHVNGPVDGVAVIARNPDGSPKTVRFSGTCGNGPACSFSVTVEDHGEPGKSDQFGIAATGALSELRSQRIISRGNIQFHNDRCGGHGNDDDDDDDDHGGHGDDKDHNGHHNGHGR
jgi:hypothetical protein